MNRVEYMNAIDNLMRNSSESDLDTIEDILLSHGASEDDSDPTEGFFITMSNADLKAAYDEIVYEIEQNRQDPESYYMTLRHNHTLTEYEQGWLDGYEAANANR